MQFLPCSSRLIHQFHLEHFLHHLEPPSTFWGVWKLALIASCTALRGDVACLMKLPPAKFVVNTLDKLCWLPFVFFNSMQIEGCY